MSATFLALYRPSLRLIQIVALAGLIVMLGKRSLTMGNSWSPYYKIFVYGLRPGVYTLNVNGIPHQMIESMTQRRRTEPVYFLPYRRIHSNPLRNVLIVGAGNGSDAAIALAAGAKHVDAVEAARRTPSLAC